MHRYARVTFTFVYPVGIIGTSSGTPNELRVCSLSLLRFLICDILFHLPSDSFVGTLVQRGGYTFRYRYRSLRSY